MVDGKSQIALVTGASRGIGESIVKQLDSHGASVVLVARSENKIEEHGAKHIGEGISKLTLLTYLGLCLGLK